MILILIELVLSKLENGPLGEIHMMDLSGKVRNLQTQREANYEASLDAEYNRINYNTAGKFVPIRVLFEVTGMAEIFI